MAGVLLAVCLGALAMYVQRSFHMPGPLDGAKNVVIPRGGTEAIADRLRAEDIVAGRRNFQVATLLTRNEGNLRAGEFTFPAHASLRDVLTVLRTARPVQHSLTIPEGLTAKQIQAILLQADNLSGPVEVIAEGSILPESYQFELGTAPAAILARGRAAMTRAMDQQWSHRAPDLPLATPQEALILASIVERETALPEERPLVAAVFLNRLRHGMRLQSDPTVIFGASAGAGVLDRPLSRADLDRDNPFNTYRIRGLPPGPICSPGISSLHAALHPATTADLYFVADGTGGHAFAHTLEDHNRNVARWRGLGQSAERKEGQGSAPAPR